MPLPQSNEEQVQDGDGDAATNNPDVDRNLPRGLEVAEPNEPETANTTPSTTTTPTTTTEPTTTTVATSTVPMSKCR